MLRTTFIERVLRHVYGSQPSDDSNITANLVNQYLNDGIALAAKQNYKDSIQMDGINYVNNSFYISYTGLPVVKWQQFIYQITLPQIPVGLGVNEGISTLQFSNGTNVSLTAIPLSQNQVGYYQSARPIPNKLLYYVEGIYAYVVSDMLLNIGFTVNVRMVSGGDSTNLNSLLNVPDDFLPLIFDYVTKILIAERAQPKVTANEGADIV